MGVRVLFDTEIADCSQSSDAAISQPSTDAASRLTRPTKKPRASRGGLGARGRLARLGGGGKSARHQTIKRDPRQIVPADRESPLDQARPVALRF